MRNTLKYIEITIILFLIIICTVFVVKKELQNDTFYSIKVGEHLVKNGINSLDIDTLSMHQNLKYCNPHVISDILIYISFCIRKLSRSIYFYISIFNFSWFFNILYM